TDSMVRYYIGVDVGTHSVRAGLVDGDGVIHRTAEEKITILHPKSNYYMQSSSEIWRKCCLVVKMLPDCWKKAGHFFDLSDFLTFKCTGSLSRSSCSVTCKWLYSAYHGWDDGFWTLIGLGDLIEDNYAKIGDKVLAPGTAVKDGLTHTSALEMGLVGGTAVATSMLDAHCGGLGCLGLNGSMMDDKLQLTECLAMICGTSSCHMAISKDPVFVPGVWGPYNSAMIPHLWLSEGGQTAAGKLVDHIISTHPANSELQKLAHGRGTDIYSCLNDVLADHVKDSGHDIDELSRDIHMQPDHHGNRSPLANPSLTGALCGLTLDTSLQQLACLYLATMQSLACGSRHIVDTMEKHGHKIKAIFMCGGLTKNQLFVQIHSNVMDRPVILSRESETVLLGGAILAACASPHFTSIQEAMGKMCCPGDIIQPIQHLHEFYEKKYTVFLQMIKNQQGYQQIMRK
uniref:Uncharacterized protein n=1 Tax=Ciona savignyi TaxID=51511 RepID=H2YYV5_CIOSA